jgi:response regulator RpfG family c-di-GMP phosphodiesterase
MKNRNSRLFVHYGYTFLVLLIYGGQVCPFLETLTLTQWCLILLSIMAFQIAVRFGLVKILVLDSPPEKLVYRQFITELVPFLLSGIIITGYNFSSFGFPVASGLKVVLGFSILGFFTAADQGLARERELNREVVRGGLRLLPRENYFPISRKFALVAAMLAFSLCSVMFLLVVKDLDWMVKIGPDDTKTAIFIILGEIAFVMVALLVPTLNLVISFATNLKMFLSQENDTLIEVSRGNLEQYVPVSTSDEFGVMARYTNRMIDGLKKLNHELELTQDTTIRSMASLAETRDNETGAHILRTQKYIRVLARQLKGHPRFADSLDDTVIDLLHKSAPLHDIGKVGVPDRVLLKPGKLDPDEWEEMKKHTVYGRDTLARAEESLETESSFLHLAREIAYCHHEKWDGSGYPEGISRDRIPVSARFMALSDVYDALISKRVYKKAFSHEEAKRIIVEGKGAHFDPDVVDAFLAIESEFIEIADQFRDSDPNPKKP